MELDGDVQRGDALAVSTGRAASVLDQEGEGGDLEQDSELGLGGGGGDVGEDALLLDQDLEDLFGRAKKGGAR